MSHTAVRTEPGARGRTAPVRRRRGLLPRRMLRYRAPRWWQELAIILVGYWLYGRVRNLVPEQASIAFRHARSIQHLQDALGLNFELSVNRFVAHRGWVAQPLDYYYATLHFIVTVGVLVWLFRRHSHVYRAARSVLVLISLIGLAGFFLYPLAPPRLLPQFGYVDTVLTFHTWGSLADPNIAAHSNQFAAMPSLHIAWAMWAGITLFRCARHAAVRILGLFYPVGTLIVIVGTANHFILDAVAGALVVGAAYGLQRLLAGHGAYRPPLDAPDSPLAGELSPGAVSSVPACVVSSVEDPFDDPAGTPGRAPVVVD